MVNIGCPIAVYTHSAIAVADPGTDITAGRDIPSHPCGTYIIEEPIFSKWKDWVSKGYHDDPPDFCPRNDRQSLPATPGNAWQYQDFGSGRIYVNWVSGGIANGPYFVPRVFVDAIEALGGVDVTGLPVSDPLECWTAHTWLFQQFARTPNIASSSFLSTLEIKGEPPVLYLERQGGNLIALKGAGIGLPSITPTICESRPCLGHHGPCDLTPPHYTSRLLSSQVESICHGTTFALRPADVREWEPVNGDCTTTTAVGFLTESHLSDQDLSTSHHHHYNPSGLITSDWCYDIIPLANFNYVLANNDKLEIEIEAGDLGYFSYDSIGVGLQKGALLQASGRWIIDCGHDDYSSEIHPPGLLAYTRTGTLPWTTSPATLTTISVNGYWNKLPVSVDIRPPPRPAPNAFLRLFKPVDSEAGWGLTTTWEFDPDSFSFVRVSFSSANPPICTVDTSYSGQVWPIPTQEYYGIWYLGWQLDSAYTVSSYDY